MLRRVFGDPASPLPADDTSDVSAIALSGLGQLGPAEARPGGAAANAGGVGRTAGFGMGAALARSTSPEADRGIVVPWLTSPTDQPGTGGAVGLTAAGRPTGASVVEVTESGALAEAAANTAVADMTTGTDQFAPAGLPAVGPAGVAQAATGSTGHEQLDLDHIDLDDLSARIYGRLRRRLRAELLIDRERAGLLTDFH